MEQCRWLLMLCTLTVLDAAVFNVKDYGARGDGTNKDTAAIAKAMAACAAAGGGIVLFPAPGIYLTGSFSLISNLVLQIPVGAVIQGTHEPADYPLVEPLPSYPYDSANTNPRHASLVYGVNLRNVTILGGGVIDGDGPNWWKQRLPNTKPSALHMRMVRDLTVKQITVRNSGWWTIHPWACSNVLFDSITVWNPVNGVHTDGLNPDSSDNVRIINSKITTNDDHISMKSGKMAQGIAFKRPTQNVLISGNRFEWGGGIAIGSETSGGIYNVVVTNNTYSLAGMLVRMKTCPDYGAGVQNITFSDSVIESVGVGVYVNMAYECYGTQPGPNPVFKDIFIRNIRGPAAISGDFNCSSVAAGCTLHMDNVNFSPSVGWTKCLNVHGKVTNVTPKPCYGD